MEEGFLIHVLDEWRARTLWVEIGSTLTPSDLDDATKRQLIPQFAQVVAGLVARGWIELNELRSDIAGPVPLAGPGLQAALEDPDSWVMRPDLRHRIIELVTTDGWKQHVTETA